MPKFRQKPVVIEAMQWDGSLESAMAICRWANSDVDEDPWVDFMTDGEGNAQDVLVHTLEGEMSVSIGNWVIKGVKGECYPCKPDIFEALYELVSDE